MNEELHGSFVGTHSLPSQADVVAETGASTKTAGEGANKPAAAKPVEIGAQDLALLKLEALDAAPVGFIITNKDGTIVWANSASELLTGYPPAELLGQNPRIFNSGLQSEPFYREMWETILAGLKWQGELINRRKDGTFYHEELSITPVRDAEGEISHFISAKRDVTERKGNETALRRSDELFRQVTENIQEVFFVYSPEPLRVIYISPAYEQIWGRNRAEVYERPGALVESSHPEDRTRALETLLQERQQGKPGEAEFRILRPDGSLRWIRMRTFPVHDEAGHFIRVVGFAEDVTARKRAEEELRRAHHELNLALAEAGERARAHEKLTELVDMIQCCESREQAFKIVEEVLGTVFTSCGGALYLISPSRDEAEAMASWGRGEQADKLFRPQDCWALRRGKVHVVPDAQSAMRCGHARSTPDAGHICIPLMAHGETLGLLYFECPRDAVALAPEIHSNPWKGIAERAAVVGERLSLALANLQLREVLRQQSVRDPLTGLFNRRYMEETLDRELSSAARRKESVALAMCDLDRFKDFNDIFGHDAGDLVLREVAAVLKANVRHGDIVCRLGGEEFVIILPGASVDIARERLEAIRQQVQSLSITHRGRTLGKVTISAGLAGFRKDGATPEDLLRVADKALYAAKNDGRNRVVLPVAEP
jgi:diguanylate cyclase (GGDEF)-like protein/PAS domain S-box-containing protein